MSTKKIGREVSGFMCFRTEPYPWGESECIPLSRQKAEILSEPSTYPKKTIKQMMAEAVDLMEQKQKEYLEQIRKENRVDNIKLWKGK